MHMRHYTEFSGFGKTFELDFAAAFENLLRRIDDPLNKAFVAISGTTIVGTLFVNGTQWMKMALWRQDCGPFRALMLRGPCISGLDLF